MCSTEGDIEDISECSKNKRIMKLSLTKCKKCEAKPTLLLQKKDPFCRTCFFGYCDHKFRSTIGKTKQIKHGQKVLLAYSGGRKSAALLHMTKQTLDSSSLKQISFLPGILYIDESVIMPSADNEDKIKCILRQMQNYGYPTFCSRLEMVIKINTNEKLFCTADDFSDSTKNPIHHEAQNCLNNCLKDMLPSVKQDFVKHLRTSLITEIAQRAGYDYVFIGDTATSLAIDLLCDISIGRGSQISSDTNFLDTRYKVVICRPIREFLCKEIALYNHLQKCNHVVLPNLLTKTDVRSSVQRLTESFIRNLEKDFPATVFTIFRTGGKLSKQSGISKVETCLLCQSRLDNISPDECSALEALKISETLSHRFVQPETDTDISKELTIESDHSPSPETLTILNFLCHGCSAPFRSKSVSSQNIMHFFQEMSAHRIKRSEMKEQIDEFLIKEDEHES